MDTPSEIIDHHTAATITAKFLIAANNKKQDFPKLIGIAGGPCAGKSFLFEYMKDAQSLPADAVIHDPDLVMQLIPEYIEHSLINPAEAFKKWELPARQLANKILSKALHAGYNIIYMRTFALADSLDFVRAAKQSGYSFDIHFITCDLEVALDRAKERESLIKRHIPPATLTERHAAVLKLIPEITSIANNYYIYENNKNGTLPVLKHTSHI